MYALYKYSTLVSRHSYFQNQVAMSSSKVPRLIKQTNKKEAWSVFGQLVGPGT